MNKWFDSPMTENGEIISSRIRLARNLKDLPFPNRMSKEAGAMILHTAQSAAAPLDLSFTDMEGLDHKTSRALLERHALSPEFLAGSFGRGFLISQDESLCVMVNEEDHIRIQAIAPGDGLGEAYAKADWADTAMEEALDYAIDYDLGYLSACPSNTGTGLRASVMLHLPMLERANMLKSVIQAIGKFGMIARGIYGEGTMPQGSIYQVSNQLTLGQSEGEIISALVNVVGQITERERVLREQAAARDKTELSDIIYRAYGILTNARRITAKEAMQHLSTLRLGFLTGLLDERRPSINMYRIMMEIQPAWLSIKAGKDLNGAERDVFRAEYLRGLF